MSLPEFAPFPSAALRELISPDDWRSYLYAWHTLSKSYSQLSEADLFENHTQLTSLIAFIQSYCQTCARGLRPLPQPDSQFASGLHRSVYALCRRLILSDAASVSPLLQCEFLSRFACAFYRVSDVSFLLEQVWFSHSAVIKKSLHVFKAEIIRTYLKTQSLAATHLENLRCFGKLIRLCPTIGQQLCLGRQFIEIIADAYASSEPIVQDALTVFAYNLLLAPTRLLLPVLDDLGDNLQLLVDKAEQARAINNPSLLSSLASNTTFVESISSFQEKSKSMKHQVHLPPIIFTKLVEFQSEKFRTRPVQSSHSTAKLPAMKAPDISPPFRRQHISQVQDVFPDLGSAFITRLLDHYNDNVDQVIDGFLSSTLPPRLASANHYETLKPGTLVAPDLEPTTPHHSLPMRPSSHKTLPVTRKNVYDNDELDMLNVDRSQLQIGKPELTPNFEPGRLGPDDKSAILAALATFDADDDEHDDTYDADDVGGTIDNTMDADRADKAATDNPNVTSDVDLFLFSEFKRNETAFERSARGTPARKQLREQVNMTDEAIEGWLIMLRRNAKRMRHLELRFTSGWAGQQRELGTTAWYRTHATNNMSDGDEGDDADEAGRGQGITPGGQGRDGSLLPSSSSSPRVRGRGAGPAHSSSIRGRPPRGRGGSRLESGTTTNTTGGAASPGPSTRGAPRGGSSQWARAQKSIRGSNMKQRGRDNKMRGGMGGASDL